MARGRIFFVAALLHPTEKEAEEGMLSKIIVEPQALVAADENSARVQGARLIAEEFADKSDRIEVAVRPF